MNDDLHVWTYWQGPRLPYIETCLRSMARVCDVPGVQFHLVTPDNLDDFVDKGTLHPNYARLRLANMAANCIRAALLAKYGGWWWDADTVGLRSPLELTEQHPEAAILYMRWTLPPLRVLNGYIYFRPGSTLARQWLAEINYKIEYNFEQANVWLELGEKILTPLVQYRADCTEIDRELFLPIDIDQDVRRFFRPGDFRDCLKPETVCYGLNHSWCFHNKRKAISRAANKWKASPLLIHQLLHYAETGCAIRPEPEPEALPEPPPEPPPDPPAKPTLELPPKPAPEPASTPKPKPAPVIALPPTTGMAYKAPPKAKTAVVTLATGDYWKGAEVLFRSLCNHGMPENVAKIVLSNEPIKSRFALRVPIAFDYSRIKTKTGQFAQTASKFFALTLNYDRIIIIDSDIFCLQNCDFLWSDRLDALPFYAAVDSAAILYYPKQIQKLGLNKNLLFNAGTMVYNKRLMPDLHARLIESIKQGRCHSYDGGDQGYFNSFFQGIRQVVGSLPSGYNFLLDPHMPQLPHYARYLFHFAGGGLKPWEPKFARKPEAFKEYIDLWRQYAKDSTL